MKDRLQEVKDKVSKLKGKDIYLIVNKGRKKIVRFNGIIESVYPGMFIIKPSEEVDLDRRSYSYNDVLCGDITFKLI